MSKYIEQIPSPRVTGVIPVKQLITEVFPAPLVPSRQNSWSLAMFIHNPLSLYYSVINTKINPKNIFSSTFCIWSWNTQKAKKQTTCFVYLDSMVRWSLFALETTDVRASGVCLPESTYLNRDFLIFNAFTNLLLYDIFLFEDIFIVRRIIILCWQRIYAATNHALYKEKGQNKSYIPALQRQVLQDESLLTFGFVTRSSCPVPRVHKVKERFPYTVLIWKNVVVVNS